MPAAAARDLAGVLRYEIERVTPFGPDAIFWQFSVEQRGFNGGQIKVKLSLIPKAPWQPMMIALTEAGIAISAIEVLRPDHQLCRIVIDRDMSRREQRVRWRLRVATGVYGVAALAAIVLPFLIQDVALHTVERRIASMRHVVTMVEDLRDQIDGRASDDDVIGAERTRLGDPLSVIEAVTEALPDDTYITSLSLRDGHLAINGRSATAASLISALSGNMLIRNVAFTAPTIRADQANIDLFSIRADVIRGGGVLPSASAQ